MGRGKDKFDFSVLYTHGAGDYSPKFSKFSENSKFLCSKLSQFPASFGVNKDNSDEIIASDFFEFNLGYSIKATSWLEISANVGDIWNATALNEITEKVLDKDAKYISNVTTGKLGLKYFLTKKIEIPVDFNVVYFLFSDDEALKKTMSKEEADTFTHFGWQALVGIDFKF